MSLRDCLARLQSAITRERIRAWLLPGSIVAISFALHVLDPFGVGDASSDRSNQQTMRVLAPFYQPSRLVTVILIDDDYLKSRGRGWPLSYAEQGLLLRRVLSAGPAAVVVDLVYPHRHRGAEEAAASDPPKALFDPIRAITDIPLIFTAMAVEAPPGERPYEFCGAYAGPRGSAMLDATSIQGELREEIERRSAAPLEESSGRARERPDWRLALVRWSGCDAEYPLIFASDPTTVTPAFAAYRAYCERNAGSQANTGVRCDLGTPERQVTRFAAPLTVEWGAFPPQQQAFALATTCQRTASLDGTVGAGRRLLTSIEQMTLGLFEDLRNDEHFDIALPCPAVTVAPLSVLETATTQEWRELLGGHIVLVGASISGIPDMISSPVHGQLPGVVLHAMAVDNLLRAGSSYLAEPQSKTLLSFLVVIAYAFAFPRLITLLEHPVLRRSLAALSLALWVALAGEYLGFHKVEFAAAALLIGFALDIVMPTNTAVYFSLVMLAATIAGITMHAGWPPGNWLGLILLLLALSHVLKPFIHEEERRRVPSPYSVLARLYRRVRGPNSAPAHHDAVSGGG